MERMDIVDGVVVVSEIATERICTLCHRAHPNTAYLSKTGKTTYAQCPECRSLRGKSALKRAVSPYEVRVHILEQIGCRCRRCGYDEHVGALEFHHVVGKSASISTLMNRYCYSATRAAWDALVEEIARCTVLCSNCHQLFHQGHVKGNWRPVDMDGLEPPP